MWEFGRMVMEINIQFETDLPMLLTKPTRAYQIRICISTNYLANSYACYSLRSTVALWFFLSLYQNYSLIQMKYCFNHIDQSVVNFLKLQKWKCKAIWNQWEWCYWPMFLLYLDPKCLFTDSLAIFGYTGNFNKVSNREL